MIHITKKIYVLGFFLLLPYYTYSMSRVGFTWAQQAAARVRYANMFKNTKNIKVISHGPLPSTPQGSTHIATNQKYFGKKPLPTHSAEVPWYNRPLHRKQYQGKTYMDALEVHQIGKERALQESLSEPWYKRVLNYFQK